MTCKDCKYFEKENGGNVLYFDGICQKTGIEVCVDEEMCEDLAEAEEGK